jgi:hypothetical protein
MKDKLVSLGWICTKCGCPGIKNGFDCGNKNFRRVLIKLRDQHFKIIKQGLVIDSGFGYQLEQKLKANELV